jgi:NAD-dependent dihydropyrimidine dehydrogenase PreA subunit
MRRCGRQEETGMKRKIVLIDAEKCNGCGLCVPNCAEGAIQVVDGKARLVAENLCDGLGACLGECPEGAITIEEREADGFDEKVVEQHLKQIGRAPAAAHAGHGHHHGDHHHGARHGDDRLQPAGHGHHHGGGCPSARAISHERTPAAAPGPGGAVGSELGHWPVKLQLVPPTAPFFKGKNLLIAADCAPVAFGDFQRRFLKDSAVVIQCPKFGEQGFVVEKLAGIFRDGGITGITVVRMEVPCCGGLSWAVQKALDLSGRKDLPLREVVVGVRGDIVSERAQTTGIPTAG